MSDSPPKSWRPLGCLVLFLVCLNSLLLTEIATYGRNNLQHHSQWSLGKSLLSPPAMGAHLCEITRNLVAGNRLNLGSWNGYQEVLCNEIVQPDRVRFKMMLNRSSYVYVELGRTAKETVGVRLSANPDFPRLYYRKNGIHRFTQHDLKPGLNSLGWHTVELLARNGQWEMTVDGTAPEVMGPVAAGPGALGFWGGQKDVLISKVEAWQNGRLVISENFRNSRFWWNVFGVCLGVHGVLALVVGLGLWMATGRNLARAFQWLFLLGLVTLALQCFSYAFDLYFWSQRYMISEFIPATRTPGKLNPIEQTRQNLIEKLDHVDPLPSGNDEGLKDFLDLPFFTRGYYQFQLWRKKNGQLVRELIDDKAAAIATHREKTGRTILFMGSSQTWGEGANVPEQGLAAVVARELLEGTDLLVNGAEQGSNSTEQLQRYKDDLHEFHPNLVVVDLCNNDLDAHRFEENLMELARINQASNCKTLFVVEPNSKEALVHVPTNVAAMRSAATRSHVPLADMSTHFMQDPDSGVLWWDFVHPTSAGHEIAGQFIAGRIRAENLLSK